MTRIIRSIAVMAVPALILAAPGAAIAQAAKTSFGPTTTVIGPGHAAHTSTPKKLFWGDEKLDVDVFGMAGNSAGLQLLTSGKVDFIHLDLEALLVAHAKGMKIKGVYIHMRKPLYKLVVPKSAGITDIRQLKGKTLGQPVADRIIPYYQGMFAEAGLDIDKDLRIIATGVGAPVMLAFKRGDIAAWLGGDVNVAPLENRGMEFIEFKPSYYDQLLGSAIVTREEVIATRPEVVVGLARGVAKAVIFGTENPTAAIRMHWEMYPQTKPQESDEAVLMKGAMHVFQARFHRYVLPPNERFGGARPEQLRFMGDFLKKHKVLPQDYDPTTAFTGQFIQEINNFDKDKVVAAARASK